MTRVKRSKAERASGNGQPPHACRRHIATSNQNCIVVCVAVCRSQHLRCDIYTGLLKDTFCNHLKHVACPTKIKGNHHLQGNVQVYNVRIPDIESLFGFVCNVDSLLFNEQSICCEASDRVDVLMERGRLQVAVNGYRVAAQQMQAAQKRRVKREQIAPWAYLATFMGKSRPRVSCIVSTCLKGIR